jgi:hypothetical protein
MIVNLIAASKLSEQDLFSTSRKFTMLSSYVRKFGIKRRYNMAGLMCELSDSEENRLEAFFTRQSGKG